VHAAGTYGKMWALRDPRNGPISIDPVVPAEESENPPGPPFRVGDVVPPAVRSPPLPTDALPVRENLGSAQ